MEQEKTGFIKWIFAVVVTMFLLIALWLVSSALQVRSDSKSFEVDDHWKVVINDQTVNEDINLSAAYFGKLKRGETVDLYRTLDERCNDGKTIRFLVYLCSVEAYVDDELIYSFGTEEVENDVMVGSGYHFVVLPDDAAGKNLRIHMVMNEPNAYTSISAPLCSETLEAHVSFANTLTINIFICLFLFILGVILTFVSLFAIAYDRIYLRLFLIGLFSMFMGMWSICSNKILQLFSMNYLLNTNMEYVALFLAPIPFGFLVYDIRKEYGTWRKYVIASCSGIVTVFSIVSFALHYSNIVRFARILPWFHIIGGVCLMGILVSGFFTVRTQDRAHDIMSMSVFILAVSIGLDLARFNIQKYFFQNKFVLMNSFLPMGTMVFVILLLVSYLVSIYTMVLTKAEQDTLANIAFHDVLTGLNNRARCEAVFEELKDQDNEYAIINFDLNGLKFVNDKFGHAEGDNLIKTFSEALSQCFIATGDCFRLGGDEFIAIVNQKFFNGISMSIKRMEEICAQKSEALEYECRFSYGIAYSNESNERDPHKIYSIADERMYEMKLRSTGSRRFVKTSPDYEG